MAIASIILFQASQDQKYLCEILESLKQITGVKCVGEEKIAVTLEMEASGLTSFLKKLSSLPKVHNLELIFVNYEDDLDEQGFITAPPEAKKYD